MDPILHAGLSAADAAKAMTVPKGFTVKLAAGEPDVVRPIAFALDDRGRLWVAEAHTYPDARARGPGPGPHPDLRGHQRRRPVRQPQGLHREPESRQRHRGRLRRRVGRRGAVPAVHPDQGRHGSCRRARRRSCSTAGATRTRTRRSTRSRGDPTAGSTAGTASSRIRTSASPGTRTPSAQRLNAAIWRYHPTKHIFEVFAEGTSNPWGLDFNDYGHAFTTACVIPHLYHVVQGARYKRQAGKHFNPYTYDDIKTIADHVHWVGRQGRTPATAGRRRPAAATRTPGR